MNKLIKAAELSCRAYDEFTYSIGGTQVLVIENNKELWFSFRGTQTDKLKDLIEDASTDLNFIKIDTKFGTMHKGFYDAFSLVAQYIRKKALVAKRAGKKIRITGHSLGGGLSITAFMWLKFHDIDVEHCYVFGCPRVVDQATADEVNEKWKSKITRIVNNNDVVTRVPTRAMGFSHVGMLYYFTEDGELVLDGNLTWWGRFWDRINGTLSDFGEAGLDDLKDHSMKEYLNLVINSLGGKS